MSTENDGSAFGPTGDATVNFGQPGLTPEQESGFSPGGFAAQVSADDDRITPANMLARPAHRAVAAIPPMPGAVAAPPPPLAPIFAPVTDPAAPVPPVPATGVAPVPPTPTQTPAVTDPVQPFAPVTPGPQFASHPAPAPVAAPAPYAAPTPAAFPVAAAVAAPVAAPMAEPMFSNTHGFTGTMSNPILPPAPPIEKPKRFKRLVPLVAVPLVLVVGGGAFAAYQVGVFGAPGAQPSAVAPANTLAYAVVDFNPSAKAKLGAYEFTQAFESGKGLSKANFKDDLLTEAFTESNLDGFTYQSDVQPWIGDRVAVAAVPAPDTEAGVTGLVIIEQTDPEATEAALTKAKGDLPDGETLAWAFKDDYVLIGEDAAIVKAAAASETSLDDNTTYAHDKAAIGDDALAHAWVNTAAVIDALPKDVTAEVPAETLTRLDGSLIVATTLTGDHLEVSGHGFGYKATTTQPVAHLQSLPADASTAFEVTGLGESLATAWTEYAQDDAFGIGDSAQEYGLVLPDDLLALFGTDFAVAASGYDSDPQVSVLATTADPDRAVELIKDARKTIGADVKAKITKDGYAASYGDPSKDGGLDQNPAFVKAVPHAGDAHAFGYINLAEILGLARAEYTSQAGEDTETTKPETQGTDPWEDTDALEAAGFSATIDGDTSSFTFRITLKD